MISDAIFEAKAPVGHYRVDVGDTLPCWNYVLQGQSSCGNDVGAPNTILINTVLQAVRYEEVEEGTENGASAFTRTYLAQKRVFSFQVDVDDEWLDKLKRFRFWDQLWFGAENDGPNEITNLQIGEAIPIPDSDTYELEITFEDPEILEMSGCCGSAYESAPFEGCEENPGTGEPDPDDPCPSFAVDLEYDGNAINGSTSGGPETGGITYRWYYDATGSGIYTLLTEGGVSSVVPAGSGRYRVIANKGGCQSVDEILIQNECSLFEVIITLEQGVINSRIISGQGNPTYEWTYIDEEANETTLPDTGDSIVPEDTGFYRLKVTDGDCGGEGEGEGGNDCCEAEDTLFFEAETDCGMEVSISQSGMTLTAEAANCDESLTYEWMLDRGDGNGQTMYGTGPSVDVEDSGVYFVTAHCGTTCSVTAYLVYMKPCNPCDGMSISISENSGVLTANTTGGSGGVITWYVNDGSGRIAVGTGPSVAISQGGMYVAEWVINDCRISSEYLECSQEGTISFEDLCNDE